MKKIIVLKLVALLVCAAGLFGMWYVSDNLNGNVQNTMIFMFCLVATFLGFIVGVTKFNNTTPKV